MKYIREASEYEMIYEFLKAELQSERFRDDILRVMTELNLGLQLIENADLNNPVENEKRKLILGKFRGYGQNEHLFENYPDVGRWIYAEAEEGDLANIYYINYSYWNELSKNTRSPLVAAETIREGIEIYGVPNDNSIKGVKYLENSGDFPPVILLTAGYKSYIILEGHSRMTVYGLAPSYFPGSKCYIGICSKDDLARWKG